MCTQLLRKLASLRKHTERSNLSKPISDISLNVKVFHQNCGRNESLKLSHMFCFTLFDWQSFNGDTVSDCDTLQSCSSLHTAGITTHHSSSWLKTSPKYFPLKHLKAPLKAQIHVTLWLLTSLFLLQDWIYPVKYLKDAKIITKLRSKIWK